MKQAFFECRDDRRRPNSCGMFCLGYTSTRRRAAEGKTRPEIYYEYVFTSCACTQFVAEAESTTYFCLNLPKSVLSRLTNDVRREPHLARLPFYLDVLTADEVMKQWQRGMQKRRSTLKRLVSGLRINLVPGERERAPSF
jgi:hypothetical protein